jgi:ribokinase
MPKVHVVGSINRDIVAYVDHLPRPGETVLGRLSASFPGGKGANQAVSACRLGAPVGLTGRVGSDPLGDEMLRFLSGEGIDVAGVSRSTEATGIALITVDGASQNTIAVVPGANEDWPAGCPPFAPTAADIVVCQLEVPLEVVTGAFEAARAVRATTVLNPAPYRQLPDRLLHLTDLLVLNEIELSGLTGEPVEQIDDKLLPSIVRRLIARGPKAVIVTLGRAGALVVESDRRAQRVPGRPVRAVDTTGAGDCFVGALAAALLEDQPLALAAEFANRAAALSVTREGAAASMPMRAQVDAF